MINALAFVDAVQEPLQPCLCHLFSGPLRLVVPVSIRIQVVNLLYYIIQPCITVQQICRFPHSCIQTGKKSNDFWLAFPQILFYFNFYIFLFVCNAIMAAPKSLIQSPAVLWLFGSESTTLATRGQFFTGLWIQFPFCIRIQEEIFFYNLKTEKNSRKFAIIVIVLKILSKFCTSSIFLL